MKPYLVLCLGNEILSDDSFGAVVAEQLKEKYEADDNVDIEFAALAGFNLLELLRNRQNVLVVDSIKTNQSEPGVLHFFPMGTMTPSKNLTTSHQISLPTAIHLGKLLGYQLPKNVDVLAVEVKDILTLSENMTPEVSAAVPKAVSTVDRWINQLSKEVSSEYR